MGSPSATLPNAGSVPASGSGSSSLGDTGANLTDDQILGIDGASSESLDPGDESTTEGQHETPAGETREAQTAAEGEQPKDGEQTEEQIETIDQGIPPEFKTIFSQQPKLRDVFFRERAYREVFPTVAEARDIKQFFPNGIEQVRETMESVSQLQNLDRTFTSTDPSDNEKFLSELHEYDKTGFRAMAQAFPGQLHKLDPEGYQELVADVFDGAFDWLTAEAAKMPDEDMRQNTINAIQVLSHRMFGKPFQPLAERARHPREAIIRRKEESIINREKQAHTEAEKQFHSESKAAMESGLTKAIETEIDRTLAGARIDPEMRKDLIEKIYGVVDGELGNNTAFVGQLKALVDGGSKDQRHREQVVTFFTNRAKQVIPRLAAPIVKRWTSGVVSQANNRIQAGQNGRPEISSAGTGPRAGGARTPRPQDVDYSRTSDDDILDGTITTRRR